ncbi:putative membrane protein [Peptoniphilus sp. ING2-D1G]|nr:putative membrane protein [Peptoniphilus sp. ING2-D1G]
MKKFVKFGYLVLFFYFLTIISYSNDVNAADILISDNTIKAEASVYSEYNGKIQKYDIPVKLNIISNERVENNYSIGYECFFDLTNLLSENMIVPFDSQDGSIYQAGVRAYGTINYDRNVSNGTIKFNSTYGGWEPGNMYYVTDRKIILRSDFGTVGYSFVKYPNSDYFYYSVNSGWIPIYPSSTWSSAGLDTFADVHVYGMGGQQTIHLKILIEQ